MTYKGYLQKTEHGWDVLSNIQNEVIPLSPKQINYFNMHLTSTTTLYNGKEVEFEIERLYDDKYGIELIYATLVRVENEIEKLATLESEVKQDDEDLEELVNQHYPVGYWTEEQCTIRRIAFRNGYREAKENYKVESSVRELHQYKLGLEDGYNKAKETLYTKEQVMDAIELARQINYCNQDYEIIVSLKLK